VNAFNAPMSASVASSSRRSPVFCTMAATPIMLRGNKLADSVAILGSVDVCVGEMDK